MYRLDLGSDRGFFSHTPRPQRRRTMNVHERFHALLADCGQHRCKMRRLTHLTPTATAKMKTIDTQLRTA